MKAYKERQYLVFKFEDGKDVKYNLATGETIGKLGKPVKNICNQLRGYDLLQLFDSFEDKNYGNFLKYIDKKFINKSIAKHRSYWGNSRVNNITNVGSFLARIKDYNIFEKYFAIGIYDVDENIKYDLTEVPKALIKLCREHKLKIDNKLVEYYKENITLFQNFLNIDFLTLSKRQVLSLLTDEKSHINWRGIKEYKNKFYELIEVYNYNPKFLITYLDDLMTYEALPFEILSEVVDYANMMNQISPKYNKYPNNFLTTHKIASRNYNRLKTVFEEEKFAKHIKEDMEFKMDDFRIIYPKSTQEIKDEASQQSHCVASYIDKVIDGTCDILFLRNKENLEHSLITLEVRNNVVVQSRGKFNRSPSNEEYEVINKYNTYLKKLKDKKDKENNKIEVEEEKEAC